MKYQKISQLLLVKKIIFKPEFYKEKINMYIQLSTNRAMDNTKALLTVEI